MINMYELLDVIGEALEVKVKGSKFIVTLSNCEVKDHKTSSVIGSCPSVVCDSIDQGADTLFKAIRGKWLVFDAGGSRRREYSASIYQKQQDRSIIKRTGGLNE